MGFEPTEVSLGRFQGGCTSPLCDLATTDVAVTAYMIMTATPITDPIAGPLADPFATSIAVLITSQIGQTRRRNPTS